MVFLHGWKSQRWHFFFEHAEHVSVVHQKSGPFIFVHNKTKTTPCFIIKNNLASTLFTAPYSADSTFWWMAILLTQSYQIKVTSNRIISFDLSWFILVHIIIYHCHCHHLTNHFLSYHVMVASFQRLNTWISGQVAKCHSQKLRAVHSTSTPTPCTGRRILHGIVVERACTHRQPWLAVHPLSWDCFPNRRGGCQIL